ncbi:hypothetical protein BURKHO8Y_110179 [Burkholderia sp. 8Y]|nr:hypothetical protein BURKHO8Y_110179 [Burkholderia sp. 8Y]
MAIAAGCMCHSLSELLPHDKHMLILLANTVVYRAKSLTSRLIDCHFYANRWQALPVVSLSEFSQFTGMRELSKIAPSG